MMSAFSGLVKEMEQRGAKLNGYELEEAIVEKLKPLTIKVEKTSINFNIRLNPLLTIDSIESVAIEDKGLKEALNKLYKAFKIEKGDRVLVKRVGNIFYILSKVVEA